ncbi:amino acid ABC transporter ATP-binding/permease protein [Tistrella mobilis]|uniref:Transport ATP-binding protein CYDC n=1 Tax=Tistrella mobilis (strain KA081020-065) TaxID=1110502 RepID=I3TS55_TISMK|nr:ATP-binding cassette domain-containing protein [Tistrella mobilis]AFK55593.1 transport ATP-binding protein CYDC [Tistrella mobilis KA081020-065]
MRALADTAALFFRMRRKPLLGGIALAALTVLAGVALLGLSGWFITATAAAGSAAATALAFDVFRPAAGIRMLALLRTGGRYGERLVSHDATLGLLAELRERLFRAHAGPDRARALKARPARLLHRLTVEVDALDNLYLRVLLPAAAAVITAALAALALALIDTRLGVGVGLGVAVTGIALPLALARAADRPARRRAAALEALRMRTVDLVAGQTDHLMTGRIAAARDHAADAETRLALADDRLNRLDTTAAAGFGAASALLLAGSLAAAGGLVQAGIATVPQAALVVLVSLALMEPFAALRRGVLDLGRTVIAARRLLPMLTPEPAPPLPAADPPPAPSALVIEDLRFAHEGATAPLFDGLSLALARGERVALLGPSGAGKSTLVELIAGERRPDRGRIRALPHSLLGQATELFADDLAGNLLLADPAATSDRMLAALDRAGLGQLVRDHKAGLGQRLGEGGEGLSSGQRRRMALARIFLRDAPLLLLDEPTDGLDARTAADVLTTVKELPQTQTILVVTHLRREAALADRLLILEDGRITGDLRRGETAFQAALDRLRPD